MKKKTYLLFRGWLMILAICILLAYLISGRYDSEGLYIGIGILVVLVVVAFNLFKQAEKVKHTEMAYAPPTDATDQQKTKFYKRLLVFVAAAFSLATVMVIVDFDSPIKSPELSEIYVLVHYVYINAGYWPAVMIVPCIGILCTIAMLWKIRTIKSATERI